MSSSIVFFGLALFLLRPEGKAGLLLTLAYEMRDRGLTLGLATLCISGGQGLAVVLERA